VNDIIKNGRNLIKQKDLKKH